MTKYHESTDVSVHEQLRGCQRGLDRVTAERRLLEVRVEQQTQEIAYLNKRLSEATVGEKVMSEAWANLSEKLATLRVDAERLDWLQSQTHGYGTGWICRDSTTGRGMRLHETSQPGTSPTVREAIDAALAQARGREGSDG